MCGRWGGRDGGDLQGRGEHREMAPICSEMNWIQVEGCRVGWIGTAVNVMTVSMRIGIPTAEILKILQLMMAYRTETQLRRGVNDISGIISRA